MARAAKGLPVALALAVILVGLAGGSPAGSTAVAPAQTWVASGSMISAPTSLGSGVAAVEVVDGTAYIGGDFRYVGPPAGSFVALDESTTGLEADLPTVSGNVLASAPDGSGGWFVGGLFDSVGGLPRANLAHILSDGTVDAAWAPDPNGAVNALLVHDGKLYVGGAFTTAGGASRLRLAAFDAPTGALSDWDPALTASGAQGAFALAASGSVIYVGGTFTAVNGTTPRMSLAAIDATTGIATDWNPGATTSGGTAGTVRALAVSGSTIYAVGSFALVNAGTVARNGAAAFDATTGTVTAWNPNTTTVGPPVSSSGTRNAVAVSGSTVYVGGAFNRANGGTVVRNNLVATDAATGAATSWDPDVDGPVYALAVADGKVCAGGAFETVNGSAARDNVAVFDEGTATATSFAPVVGGAVYTVRADGSVVHAGGNFNSVGGVRRGGAAAIDLTTGEATSWAPPAINPTGFPSTIAVSDSTVYVGGSFRSVDGVQDRFHLVAFDRSTGAKTPWNPTANDTVNAIELDGNTLYVAGFFTNVGGQPRNRIAALDATTGEATDWNPNASSAVNALALGDGVVYAGGGFTSIGGETRNRIAALDAATGLATSWNPDASSTVNAIAPDGELVYVGGAFTAIAGVARNRIAALDASTGQATAWDPGASSTVSVLLPADASVYAAGSFTTIGGEPRNRLAELDAATGAATAWNPDPGGPSFAVAALALAGSEVVAGGTFRTFDAGASFQPWFAVLEPGGDAEGVPGAPTDVVAVAGDGQATVSFTPPDSDGGSSITGYRVTASPGGAVATGAASPIVVGPLANGTEYTFTVAAINANGTGPASAPSNAVVPVGPPGAPTNVIATAGGGRGERGVHAAHLDWRPPDHLLHRDGLAGWSDGVRRRQPDRRHRPRPGHLHLHGHGDERGRHGSGLGALELRERRREVPVGPVRAAGRQAGRERRDRRRRVRLAGRALRRRNHGDPRRAGGRRARRGVGLHALGPGVGSAGREAVPDRQRTP